MRLQQCHWFADLFLIDASLTLGWWEGEVRTPFGLPSRHVDQMRRMACFAYEHSPFYRTYYDQHGVNPSAVELPSGLPVVTPEQLADSPLQFRSDEPAFKVCASSGTSGRPKLLFRTDSDFQRSVTNQMRLMERCGLGCGDVVAVVQPFGLWGYGDLTQEATKRLGGMSVPIGPVPDQTALRLIVDLRASAIDVSPSRLESLLRMSEESGTVPKSVRVAMVAGEPVGAELAGRLQELWGSSLFNQYGSEETDGLGGAVIEGGGIALLDDDFVFELVDANEGRVDCTSTGELVITSLYHKGTPLVRYALGDLARHHPTRAPEVEIVGRSCSGLLVYDAVKLYPYQIEAALSEQMDVVHRWQCRASGAGGAVNLTLLMPEAESDESVRLGCIDSLRRCCIDVEDLVSRGVLTFDVVLGRGALISSRRGKTPRFVDDR